MMVHAGIADAVGRCVVVFVGTPWAHATLFVAAASFFAVVFAVLRSTSLEV
jgi:hypothetical protein